MAVLDVELVDESKARYLTYALSVVSARALPDVRDGLKPVQRRILYAMFNDLRLRPEKEHRKSAAIVGAVLARYHPHGDSSCYEAMVRMAQDFSLRYPLVDGQGNFGSLDGDSAAAYRYTEAKLTRLAMEVIGDIGEETVSERDNFDQTVKEPVVLPARIPNLLVNGASGIAVGMATAIPPHNLGEVVKALLLLLDDPEAGNSRIYSVIKGPDFPTGCAVVNSRQEVKEIYDTGRGAIRMRGTYDLEKGDRSPDRIVIKSVPYGIDKSQLVEKIADLIIARKLPQLEDVRDESTHEVRVVLELAKGADPQKAVAYLYKNTSLQTNFNVNLTALVPSNNPLSATPMQLSLRQLLQHFLDFRIQVIRAKLEFEKRKLLERIHLLEGLVLVCDALDEALQIVRRSSGRQDAATKLRERFKLSQEQAFFVVDLRVYQLAQTAIEEVRAELKEKTDRVCNINATLSSKELLNAEVAQDLKRIRLEYGDNRKSEIVNEYEEPELTAEEFVEHEDVYVVVSKDGWIKRLRLTHDPSSTRLREGDEVSFLCQTSTRHSLALFTNLGNVYITRIHELLMTTGFGEPVQKIFRFQDGEQIVSCRVIERGNASSQAQDKSGKASNMLMVYTRRGLGFAFSEDYLSDTKKTGKRLMRIADGDKFGGIVDVHKELLLLVSAKGYGLCIMAGEVPVLSGPGKGVILQRMPDDDELQLVESVSKNDKLGVILDNGKSESISMRALTIGVRAKRGAKLYRRNNKVLGLGGSDE